MRGRFPMSTEPRSLRGRERRVFDDGRNILSQHRVVHEPRRIAAVLREGLENELMQRASTFGRYRAIDGKTRKLMTETDRLTLHDQQAASAGFVHCSLLNAEDRFDQPSFGSDRRNGDKLGKVARARGGEHE